METLTGTGEEAVGNCGVERSVWEVQGLRLLGQSRTEEQEGNKSLEVYLRKLFPDPWPLAPCP